MAFDPTQPEWEIRNGTMNAAGVYTENVSGSVQLHSQTQDFQFRVDNEQLGTSAILKARVRPINRTVVWLSSQDDSNNNTAWFNLTGAGSVLFSGSNISSASISLVGGTSDQYDIKIVFSGTLPQSILRWACGAATGSQVQKYAGTGVDAFQILRAQLIAGNVDPGYVTTDDLQTYPDLQSSAGSQDFALPASNPPRTIGLDFIESIGDFGLSASDFVYSLDGFSVVALIDWNGDQTTTKLIGGHWDGVNDNSWLMTLTTDGKLNVFLSGDGSTIHKNYSSVRAIDINTKTMVSFTWDGTSLKLYINEVELTGAELTTTTDLALSGALHNSSAILGIIDSHFGKAYEFRIYEGAGNATDIANLASGFGVSGLPGGGGTPGPTPNAGDFLAVNGIVVIEGESFDITGAAFVEESSLSGFVGDGYIRHTGADDFSLPPADVIQVPFFVDVAGTYEIALRVNHDLAAADDEENDCWLEVNGSGFEKWGHRPVDYGSGWTFGTFREPTPGVFTDKYFELAAGSHTLSIGGRSQNWRFDRVHIFQVGFVNPENEALPESPRAGVGGGGNVPSTRIEMENYLINTHGVQAGDIFYVDNAAGGGGDGSLGSPWNTIQAAANNLSPGQACIISGNGGRFFEQVTPPSSGSVGNRIWFAGNPEAPCIVDASEAFITTWTNQGTGGGSGNRWRATYNRTRADVPDQAFQNNCTLGYPECADYSHSMSHQLIFNDQQLFVHQNGNNAVGAPGAMEAGECYFEVGTGSRATPQYVWVRLPADQDPNGESMRIASDKKYLWDYSPHEWTQGYPGGLASQKADGRSHLGLLNIHFKFGSTIRKLGPLAIRGSGWWVEWCSVSDAKHYGLGLYGQDHTIRNCKFVRNGQGGMRPEWLQENGGTETLIEDCQFIDGNFQECPRRWEAGNKFTDCMAFGTVIVRRCLFLREKAYGLWWDIFNGDTNPTSESFIAEFCVFESCWDGSVFFEHNSRKILFRHCGIWGTVAKSYKNTILGTGFRCQAAGDNQIVNCAIVYNDGKGIYFKNHDGRGTTNNDNIVNNVIGFNCRDVNVEVLRVEHLGGDGYDDNPTCVPFGPAWSASTIDNNVYFETQGTAYFGRDQNCNSFETSSSLATFQGWHGGSGNVIEANAADVVEDHTDRKAFWKTVGSHTSKGPQGLVHPEDIAAQAWTIPS